MTPIPTSFTLPAMKSKVIIRPCANYETSAVERAVFEVFEAAGGFGLVQKGARVLVKINLLNASPPEKAVVTHPEVTRAVIRVVKEAGGVPVVGDSPGLDQSWMAERVLKSSGTFDVCTEEGVDMAPFFLKGYGTVELPNAKRLSTVHIAREILEADVVIGVSKAKSHMQAVYTGAIKNFFGALPQKDRKIAHSLPDLRSFSESLVDIFSACRHHLGIMDAVVGMEGRGPADGPPRHLGLILGSTDFVALDTVTTYCIGYDHLDIPYLDIAAEAGLGKDDLERIEINGPPIADVKKNFVPAPTALQRMPGFMNKLGMWLWSVEPKMTSACTSCGHCASICPVHAIKIGTKRAIIDYDKCILCFCCHELCPDHAVKERKSLVAHVVELRNKLIRRGDKKNLAN